MDEKKRVDTYLVYLDKILAGEQYIGPVEDREVEKLLQLAKTLIATDFSINSKIKEDLRERLVALIREKDKSGAAVLTSNEDELGDEDLDRVVAAGPSGQAICPCCGATLLLNGVCSSCHHKN